MPYVAKDLGMLVGMDGFSETLLKNHFTLYQGYLYQDRESGRLFNQWVNEHDVGNPTGAAPIFVMDVFEHAFMVDYGLKRADYIAAFFRNVNWKAAEARL